jgi:hypothetical protein
MDSDIETIDEQGLGEERFRTCGIRRTLKAIRKNTKRVRS